MAYTYKYPRPSVTVDCVVFGYADNVIKILLIKRGSEPFKGQWAFPGGFVEMDETLDEASKRELEEETGMKNISLEQLHTFGGLNRDPRGRTISIVYFALIKLSEAKNVKGGSDAAEAKWFDLKKIPAALAFDHKEILQVAVEHLQSIVSNEPDRFDIPYTLLKPKIIF